MKYVKWGNTDKKVPAIALGCMRMNGISFEGAVKMVDGALAVE